MKRAALTGHRPDKLRGEYDLIGPCSEMIMTELDKIIELYQPDECISGMALGADMLWAICALYHGIPLTAAIPFEGQEKMWPEKSKQMYHKILSHPLTTKVYVCDPGYEISKMQTRNEWMVDHSNLLIAVWDGSNGGTYNCIKYAKRKKKRIHYIRVNELMVA